MAVPFRRTSYKKKQIRRQPEIRIFLKKAVARANGLIKCSNCNEIKKSHWICKNCSFYGSEKDNS